MWNAPVLCVGSISALKWEAVVLIGIKYPWMSLCSVCLSYSTQPHSFVTLFVYFLIIVTP